MNRNDVMICVHVAGSSSHCVQNLQVLDLLRVGKKIRQQKGWMFASYASYARQYQQTPVKWWQKPIKTHAKSSRHQKIAVLAACYDTPDRYGRIEMLSASCVRWSYDCSTPIPSSVRRSYVTLCGKRLVDVNWRWPPWMGKVSAKAFTKLDLIV